MLHSLFLKKLSYMVIIVSMVAALVVPVHAGYDNIQAADALADVNAPVISDKTFTTAESTKVIWKLATYSLPGTLQTNLLQEFADKVNAASEDQMEIQIYAGGSLYSMTEIFDAVSSGAIDLGYTGVTSYIGKTPRTSSILTYTSVVAKDLADLSKLTNGLADSPILQADAAANNIQHLFFGPLGTVDAFFKFPVNSMDDLEGKKLGCSKGVAPIVNLMGAVPVAMDIANAYLSLKTGLIDGWLLSPLEYYVSMSLYEVAPYLVSLSFNSSMSVLMNQASFSALPASLQSIVDTAAQETQADWNNQVTASDAGYINTLKAIPGVNVKVLTSAERVAWFDSAIVPVFTGLLNKFLTADEVTQTKALIAAIQAESSDVGPWPMFRHDLQHTGRSLYSGPSSPTLKWSYATGAEVYSSPAIDSKGNIYVGSQDKKIYALNPDGTLNWSYTTGGPIRSSAAIGSDGTIHIGSQDKKIYALNPDGTLKWSYATGV